MSDPLREAILVRISQLKDLAAQEIQEAEELERKAAAKRQEVITHAFMIKELDERPEGYIN